MANWKRWAVRINKLNEWVARWSVRAMSSMAAVYIFLGWSLLPSLNKNWETLVFYVSGGIIQLVALPLIMVGQRLEGKASERQMAEDHKMLKSISDDLKAIKDQLNNRPT